MRELESLSYEEYQALNRMGMLFEFYPEATGDWYEDRNIFYNDEQEGQEEEEVYVKGFDTYLVYSDGDKYKMESYDTDEKQNVEDFIAHMFDIYKALGFCNRVEVKIINPLFKNTKLKFDPIPESREKI